jgi:hypothetical protein
MHAAIDCAEVYRHRLLQHNVLLVTHDRQCVTNMYTVLGTLGLWFADKDSMYSNPPLATFAVTFPRVLGDPMAFPGHFQEGLGEQMIHVIFSA